MGAIRVYFPNTYTDADDLWRNKGTYVALSPDAENQLNIGVAWTHAPLESYQYAHRLPFSLYDDYYNRTTVRNFLSALDTGTLTDDQKQNWSLTFSVGRSLMWKYKPLIQGSIRETVWLKDTDDFMKFRTPGTLPTDIPAPFSCYSILDTITNECVYYDIDGNVKEAGTPGAICCDFKYLINARISTSWYNHSLSGADNTYALGLDAATYFESFHTNEGNSYVQVSIPITATLKNHSTGVTYTELLVPDTVNNTGYGFTRVDMVFDSVAYDAAPTTQAEFDSKYLLQIDQFPSDKIDERTSTGYTFTDFTIIFKRNVKGMGWPGLNNAAGVVSIAPRLTDPRWDTSVTAIDKLNSDYWGFIGAKAYMDKFVPASDRAVYHYKNYVWDEEYNTVANYSRNDNYGYDAQYNPDKSTHTIHTFTPNVTYDVVPNKSRAQHTMFMPIVRHFHASELPTGTWSDRQDVCYVKAVPVRLDRSVRLDYESLTDTDLVNKIYDTLCVYERRPKFVTGGDWYAADVKVADTIIKKYRDMDSVVSAALSFTPNNLDVASNCRIVAVPSANSAFSVNTVTNMRTSCTAKSATDTGGTCSMTYNVYAKDGKTSPTSESVVSTIVIRFTLEYYEDIVPRKQSVYLTGSTPVVTVPIDTSPATSLVDTLSVESSNEDIATVEIDDHVITVTQVDTGRCTILVTSTIVPESRAYITVLSGSTEPGGADDEPDDYTNYPVPTDPEDPLEPEARAQHAYFYDLDWRTSQLKQHCGGFDHGIGRGKTFNAAPGTLYIVYSEHSKREYFRDGIRTEGMEDQLGKYVPTPLLQGDDVWHTDYEAPAFLDTGNIADRNGTSNKRFREVQYILALDGNTDMQVAFAFLVDGAMRRPMLKPVAEYDPEADVITVSTEYDEPYSVAESTVGNLGEWKLDAHTLENAERVRVRQNVTGKGITASTRIVFKMSGQFKLLGVNYIYREMYSR